MKELQAEPQISVIIVNWNGLALLDECLRSLKDQTFKDFETILVDNGSTDGSAEWVKKHHPGVRLLELKSNLGFSAGNNAGLALARGNLSPCSTMTPRPTPAGWRHCTIALKATTASPPVIQGYFTTTGRTWSGVLGEATPSPGSVFSRFNREPEEKASRNEADVFIAVACAALYRKELSTRSASLTKNFFNGYEDVDWSFRAHLAGYRIVNQPKAVVCYKVSSTQVHNSPEFVYHGQRNVSAATFIKNMPGRLILKYWPLHWHTFWAAWSILQGRAASKAFLKAKRDLSKMFPRSWRKRKAIQARRNLTAAEVDQLLEKRWLAVKARKF